MARNPHPHTIEEFEHDVLVYGPPSAAENLSTLRELTRSYIRDAERRIRISRGLIELLGTLRPEGSDRAPSGPLVNGREALPGRQRPVTDGLASGSHQHLERTGQDGRLLRVLQRLLGLDAIDLSAAMAEAAQMVADALGADKVDVFLHVPAEAALIAEGISDTRMGRRQKALGLDRLPLASGGRTAQVFASGQRYICDDTDEDALELPAVVNQLGVRSTLAVPLEVNGVKRGVVVASSARPAAFTSQDLDFLAAVARWIGLTTARLAHAEWLTSPAAEQALRRGAGQFGLTPRQLEVVALIRQGLTNGQVAHRLRLDPGTVANHVASILQRLEFQSRAQIAAWAVERGIGRQNGEAR